MCICIYYICLEPMGLVVNPSPEFNECVARDCCPRRVLEKSVLNPPPPPRDVWGGGAITNFKTDSVDNSTERKQPMSKKKNTTNSGRDT